MGSSVELRGPPIGKALAFAFGVGEDRIAALFIGEAGLRAGVVAEVIFREITVKGLLAAVLVDAFHAALEDRKKPSTVFVSPSPRTCWP